MDELNNNILEKLSGKEQYEYYQEQVEDFFEKYIITEIKNRNIKNKNSYNKGENI